MPLLSSFFFFLCSLNLSLSNEKNMIFLNPPLLNFIYFNKDEHNLLIVFFVFICQMLSPL